MKWAILAAFALTVYFGLPFREYETGQLLPIKTLCAEYDGGVHIVSEVAQGWGETWQEAVENLRNNASGDVFFDTAEHLVVTDLKLAADAKVDLRASAQVYIVSKLPPMEGLHDYLKAHPSENTLEDV